MSAVLWPNGQPVTAESAAKVLRLSAAILEQLADAERRGLPPVPVHLRMDPVKLAGTLATVADWIEREP